MSRVLIKKDGSQFTITPLSGPHAGHVIARAEQLRIKSAAVAGQAVSGIIEASWGLEVTLSGCVAEVRSLGVGKVFGPMGKVKTFRPGVRGYEANGRALPEKLFDLVHLDDLGLHVPVRFMG